MRILFLQDAQLESEGRNRGPRYPAGSVQDLRPDQAERWIRRGVAEKAAADASVQKQPEAAKPAQEPAPPVVTQPEQASEPTQPPATKADQQPVAAAKK